MPKIKPGTKVPDFSLPMTGGGTWSLKDAAGKKLVIYFYPKDMTSGLHARVAGLPRSARPTSARPAPGSSGISRDSVASHDKFAAKESLPFPLLADTDEKVCKLFDVIKQKSLYGRKYLGVERSTFLLDGAGVSMQEWRKVKVPGHAEEVLEAAQRL